MSGLSKTHGFAIPTGLNVNCGVGDDARCDYVKTAAQPLNIIARKGH